jgi:hypothetical protein
MQSKMNNKDRFTEWYKNKIESNPHDPPESVWNNIQDDLDVENVWQRISHQLYDDRKKILQRSIPYAAAAAILLLLLLLNPFKPQRTYDLADSQLNKNFPSLNQTLKHEKNIQEDFTGQVTNSEEKSAAYLASDLKTPETNLTASLTAASVTKEKENDRTLSNLQKLNTLPADINASLPPAMIAASSITEDETTSSQKENEKAQPVFYAGLSGELGKSWLLSNKTIYSITESPYSSANPTNESAFGFLGGIKLNDKWSVELATILNDNRGQIYREYLNGQLVTNKFNLKYSTFSIKGRYKIIPKTLNLPVSHNLMVGTYVGYLNKASQSIESEKNNIKPDYRNYDIGLLIGYEIDSQILPNYTLSTGIQIDPGLINIYKGNEELPANFNKTYNASIGVSISIKRNF